MLSSLILSFKYIESKVLFKYILILIGSYIIIGKKKIKLSHILSLFIGLSIVFYLRLDTLNNQSDEGSKKEIKINVIKPEINRIRNYDDILNYLFSIQDLYIYNQESYEEMINNIELFLEVYEKTIIDEKYYTQYYKIADRVRRSCLNNLHSIIYNIGNKTEVKEKLNNALISLNEILNNYMDNLFDICKRKKNTNGYDNKTIPISNDIPAYNEYEVKDYTYNIY